MIHKMIHKMNHGAATTLAQIRDGTALWDGLHAGDRWQHLWVKGGKKPRETKILILRPISEMAQNNTDTL